MRSRCRLLLAAMICILCVSVWAGSTVKRGRNEGTMNIDASNVIGNGNITVATGTYGNYGPGGARIDPTVGLHVGVSNIIELKAATSFTNFAGLGTSEAHIQFTTPGNDRLRFIGIGISGDLFLSTTADTLSESAASGKPEYSPFMLPSGVIDLDWLAFFKTIPLKTYFAVSFVDEPLLLHRYEQIGAVSGFEWKQYRHSYFIDIGAGFYKEKRSGSFRGDSSYFQRIAWFEPGVRYRLFGIISLLGSFRVMAYQKLKELRPLPAAYVRASFWCEIPLLYKETNTEAIRTLVFLEREKAEKKDKITSSFEQGKRVESGLDKAFKSLHIESEFPDSEQEKAELQKRKEIEKKMEEIEQLLEEIE
ncbi:MAG: hypothetical protein JW768_02220 [Chitinispirillaceae bacterium]|nr:hypothetical protein [Chitinispirillaceae bacterium]